MQSSLLLIHITAGFMGLVSALGALTIKVFDMKHLWHIRFGKVFFWSMVIVAITAVPLAFYVKNVFLLLVALFSAYLTHGGRRYANNRAGELRKVDSISIKLAFVTALAMLAYGIYLLVNKDSQGITLIVFSLILLAYSVREYKVFLNAPLKNNERIAMHLSQMLAAMIASITAFVVTNFELQPEFVLWLMPSAVITPIIIYWNRKLLNGN